MLGVLDTSTHFRRIVRPRELVLGTRQRSTSGMKYLHGLSKAKLLECVLVIPSAGKTDAPA